MNVIIAYLLYNAKYTEHMLSINYNVFALPHLDRDIDIRGFLLHRKVLRISDIVLR